MKEDLLTILFLMSNIPLERLSEDEQKRLRRSLNLYLRSLRDRRDGSASSGA